jgi:hypothetical protein
LKAGVGAIALSPPFTELSQNQSVDEIFLPIR